ncbi:carbon monoxide dehydrogenase subunit G [Pigmentiphaga soli]|uniref:Carbon monoxide dehydrogenase subunit G n=1 Tax=Pigmentiphaga soli TaxID=1007095 RepID=A0ABP8GDP5_9BURK
MKITGERVLAVPVQRVWDKLFDPETLKRCIPGCESVEKEGDALYKAVVAMAIGPLRARFAGKLQIHDAEAPVRCRLVFEGSGGAVGFAKGSVDVSLAEAEAGTRLAYEADTQIAGKLAQVGARLIDSVAKKLAGEFFDRFEETVAAGAA